MAVTPDNRRSAMGAALAEILTGERMRRVYTLRGHRVALHDGEWVAAAVSLITGWGMLTGAMRLGPDLQAALQWLPIGFSVFALTGIVSGLLALAGIATTGAGLIHPKHRVRLAVIYTQIGWLTCLGLLFCFYASTVAGLVTLVVAVEAAQAAVHVHRYNGETIDVIVARRLREYRY